jgi:hypothetical protein
MIGASVASKRHISPSHANCFRNGMKESKEVKMIQDFGLNLTQNLVLNVK